MKRLALLIVLSLSFAFGCDVPHESIASYDMGCKYTADNGKSYSDPAVKYYLQEKEVYPFDTVEITTLNDEIAVINMYIDPNYYLDDQVVSDVSRKMEERWGSFFKDEYGIYVNKAPKSEVVGRVSIYKPDKSIGEKLFSITYQSKKYLEYEKNKSEKTEAVKEYANF